MPESRVSQARKAFSSGDVEAAKQAHAKRAIQAEHHGATGGRYLGDLVYGAIDGIVTTFAVIAGVAGASLSVSVVLILGMANLMGDGISMAIGNYLSTKSEVEYHQRERSREEWEIQNTPEGEREEIRQIYKRKGFKGKDLDRAVDIITSDKNIWVDTMMIDELGLLADTSKSPFAAGLATFIAFVVAGFMPLIAYVLSYFLPFFRQNSFPIATIATALTLFVVGSARTVVTGKKWYISGLEILFVGGAAAVAAYLVGFLLRGLA